MMIDKNPVLSVVDGKMCINGKTFEHTELRESKEYLQSIDAEEALFYPENEEEIEELTEIVTKMGEMSPEFIEDELNDEYHDADDGYVNNTVYTQCTWHTLPAYNLKFGPTMDAPEYAPAEQMQ